MQALAGLLLLGGCTAKGSDLTPARFAEVLPEAGGAWAVNVQSVDPEEGIGEAWLISYYSDPTWMPGGCVSSGKVAELYRETHSEHIKVIAREDISLGYFTDDGEDMCRYVSQESFFPLSSLIDIAEATAAAEIIKGVQRCLRKNGFAYDECFGDEPTPYVERELLDIDPRLPLFVAYDEGDDFLRLYYERSRDAGLDLLVFHITRSEHGMQLIGVFRSQPYLDPADLK